MNFFFSPRKTDVLQTTLFDYGCLAVFWYNCPKGQAELNLFPIRFWNHIGWNVLDFGPNMGKRYCLGIGILSFSFDISIFRKIKAD